MNKEYLNKVVDQIISETEIDYDRGVIKSHFLISLISASFLSFSFVLSLLPNYLLFPSSFSNHCRDVYGLNDDEIEYVWEEYREIIKDMIKNNG
jgi:hypothetical protein